MIGADVHQRTGYRIQSEEGGMNGSHPNSAEEDDDDLSPVSGEARPLPPRVLVDPGHFKYNRKICLAAIPCLLLILAICGEALLLLVSAGIALILIVDTGSNNQRTLVVFMMIFVPCHVTILYFTFPLIWVSYINIILLALMNSFILLSGAWAVLQIAIFRMQEPEVCVFLEQILFTLYPGLSACLMTWAVATIIPLKFLSIVLLFISFALFQVFLTPTISSFKPSMTTEGEDTDILHHTHIIAVAIVFNSLPLAVHGLIGVYQVSLIGIVQFGFICEVLLLLTTSVLLTTLLSTRHIADIYGLSYSFVVKVRSVCGVLAVLLSYPVLRHLGVDSHFLEWLPLVITAYAIYGGLLSYKQYKARNNCYMPSLFLLTLSSLMSVAWSLKLPWRLSYTFLFGLSQSQVFVMMILNSIVCLTTAYTAFHCSQQILTSMILIQTSMFIGGEVILFESRLYDWHTFLLTTVAALYTLHRCQISKLLSDNIACACMSAHITKSLIAMMFIFIHQSHGFSYLNIITLYFFVFMTIKMLLCKPGDNTTVNQVILGIFLMSLSVMMNVVPFFYILTSYIFGVDASMSDVIGLCSILCGVLTVASGVLHLPSENRILHVGIVEICTGILCMVTQPSFTVSWYGLFQLLEFLSFLCTIILLSGDYIKSIIHLLVISTVVGNFPGLQAAFYLYPDGIPPMLSAIIYCLVADCLCFIIFCIAKAYHLKQRLESSLIYSCITLEILNVLSIVADLIMKDKKDSWLLVPAWKIFLCSNLAVCLSMKFLISQTSEIIPIHGKEDKEISYIPLVGNITAVKSFILLCLLSPTHGFLHDIWCCGATIVLSCIQKDMIVLYNLKNENQTTVTKMAAVTVLVLGTLYRSDLWHATSWSFIRAGLEVLLTVLCLPLYYALWGVLWNARVPVPEVVVVFILPLHFAFILYGSSYTSWAMAATGLFSSIWMASTSFRLKPNSGFV
ncbi:hypothetical protein FSP39_020313 [Pinctada imbricata]|uniref:Uncharacterized protein n=1 Tax=Pinctada imbricata TaxID=66713 RepID=A0AA88Y4V6_PINIB|nr:hypothetical protein FSP39_020313 [Pinctada imbricata]